MKLPDKLDMSFHNCERDRKWLGQLYISARVSEDFLYPLVLQMILHKHKKHQKSNQELDVQGKLAKVVSVCQQKTGNAR